MEDFDLGFFEHYFVPCLAPLARYHRFGTCGVGNVPVDGPALIVGTHSAMTYDAFLAIRAIYLRTGRVVRGLADDFWFGLPGVRRAVAGMGAVRASPGASAELLQRGQLVAVAPGGMREGLRPSSQRFQVWADDVAPGERPRAGGLLARAPDLGRK